MLLAYSHGYLYLFRETVRKKAYVALYWQLEVDPQLQDQLLPIFEKGLVDKDPSVLGAVIGIWRNLIKVSIGVGHVS